jgi:hypothetical protein
MLPPGVWKNIWVSPNEKFDFEIGKTGNQTDCRGSLVIAI